MNGRVILPGITDSHIHLNYFAKSLTQVDCATNTKEDCLANVRQKVLQTQPGEWVIGHGWNQNNWQDGYGTISDLDEISKVHPIYLTAKSLHASWANSLALMQVGINKQTQNPDGGMIGKNSNGELSGILFEKATLLVEKNFPHSNIVQTSANLEIAQKKLWEFGITSVHDFDGKDCFLALQKLEKDGKLKIRVLKSIPLDIVDAAIEFGVTTGFGSDFLKIGSVKLFSDGALGPQTAAMIDPYENNLSNFGVLLLTSDEIFEIGIKALDSNISMAIHAIGDLANKTVLDGFKRLSNYEEKSNKPEIRHRIEHVQILNRDLLNQLVELKITASVQPIHLISDMDTADKYWGTRSQYAYPFQSLLQNGTNIVFGSDSPVESPNPFLGIFAATCRRKENGFPDTLEWYPEQKISLFEAIQAYTTSPAKLAGWKKYSGRIFPNEFADLIVLDEDIFQLPNDQIKNLLPSATMVSGEWMWQK
jgi:predicted amidohydrolase YtcJ